MPSTTFARVCCMIQDIMVEVNRQQKTMNDYGDASDEAVLAASRKDPRVFAVLVDRYEAAFLRKAQSILYSREDAEEVVQDTFTRVYLYADRYKPQEGAIFSSWAYAILTNLCFTRYQKLKKLRGRTTALDPEVYERLKDDKEFLEDLTLQDQVFMALAKLPETAARVLRLQFLEGKTQEEIAELEGTSVGAVKTRVHRAKILFKEVAESQLSYDEKP